MCSAKRRFDPGVIQQFLDEPYRFEFFQAVRMLELYFSQQGRGELPVDGQVEGPREGRGRIEDILSGLTSWWRTLKMGQKRRCLA